jgi:hypothetical protein
MNWFLCFARRQSQLASQGPQVLAEKLTESLRNTGDLDIVETDLQSYVVTFANVTNDFLNLNTIDNRFHLVTTTKSCFQRRGALNLLNHSCSLFVHPMSYDTLHDHFLSHRLSHRLRVARATHHT